MCKSFRVVLLIALLLTTFASLPVGAWDDEPLTETPNENFCMNAGNYCYARWYSPISPCHDEGYSDGWCNAHGDSCMYNWGCGHCIQDLCGTL